MALKEISVEPRENPVNLGEKGKNEAGETIALDRRLFIQLLAFTGVSDPAGLIATLNVAGLDGVLYADVNDPYGVGLLTFSPEPDFFLERVRPLLMSGPFRALTPRPMLTMLGRTYTIGYERDLERVLIRRPIERITNPAWPWAIWYPLRRSAAFELLPPEEQRVMLLEHGGIGRAFGEADLAHDIRLACHGLGREDNDFIVGLVGRELAPLSQIIQRMRKTRQTALYLEKLGPFFTGRALWQRDAASVQPSGSPPPP